MVLRIFSVNLNKSDRGSRNIKSFVLQAVQDDSALNNKMESNKCINELIII